MGRCKHGLLPSECAYCFGIIKTATRNLSGAASYPLTLVDTDHSRRRVNSAMKAAWLDENPDQVCPEVAWK